MVTYQTWTSVAFDVAEAKGEKFENIQEGGSAVQIFAEIWQDRKTELQTATRSEARKIAEQEISV